MADTQFVPLGTVAAPAEWTLPSSLEIVLKAATATFDGSAAATAYRPTLEVISDSGHSVGIYTTDVDVAAGASAEVSFFPFSGAAAPAAAGASLDQVIALLGPDAWWKLDEASGSTAHDSSGNGWDLTTTSGDSDPLWGQPALAPGTPAAGFTRTGPRRRLSESSHSPVSGDFTIMCWFTLEDNLGPALIGQAAPLSGNEGFGLRVTTSSFSPPLHAAFIVSTSVAVTNEIYSDNPLVLGGSYFVAGVFESSVMTLYVDGAAQSTHATPTIVPGSDFYIAGSVADGTAANIVESYGVYFAHALPPAQVAALYLAA